MTRVVRRSARLCGEVIVPGDKSITHRAILIGAIADGWSEVHGALNAGDSESTMACLNELGVETVKRDGVVRIHGRGLRGFSPPSKVLDAGNSATTLRLLTGLLVGQRFDSTITGDASLLRRPMKRIIDPLSQMGARVNGTSTCTPPLSIRAVDSLRGIEYTLPLPSAQVKSAIIFAGLYAEGITRITEAVPSRDHTERMLGLQVEQVGEKKVIEVKGGVRVGPRSRTVPGDLSSAAYFLVGASLIPGSELLLRNVCMNPTRTGVIDVLRSMGATILVENERTVDCEPTADLIVKSSQLMTGFVTRGSAVPNIIDEIPALSVAAACARGSWEVRDAADLRNKESDRIRSTVSNLRALGAAVEEYPDGFLIEGGSSLAGATVRSFGDHRIAMMCGILGLLAKGETEVEGADVAEISYPDFWGILKELSS